MPSHNHKHEHCEHPRIKFCKDCRVVHCLDCKVEWSTETCKLNHYPWGISAGYGGVQSSMDSVEGSVALAQLTTFGASTICNHEGTA